MSRTKKKQKRRPLCPNNGSCSWCAQGRQHRKLATAEHSEQDIRDAEQQRAEQDEFMGYTRPPEWDY
jgi:hypothetical protein